MKDLRTRLREDAQHLRASGGPSLREIAGRIDELLAETNPPTGSVLEFAQEKQARDGDLVLVLVPALGLSKASLDGVEANCAAIHKWCGARVAMLLLEDPRGIVLKAADLKRAGLALVEPS